MGTKSLALEHLWDQTLAEATQTRDFGQFTAQLIPEACLKDDHADGRGLLAWRHPTSWRFNNMPYGRDSPETVTFPFHDTIDAPRSSLYFHGDVGSVGDYCERVDNKVSLLKKARLFYSSSYIPPTK